jgi:hypothetical protein
MTTIDISGIWAQGTLFELEPDVLLFTYGGRGPGAGGEPWNARYQKMRVDTAAKRLVHLPPSSPSSSSSQYSSRH